VPGFSLARHYFLPGFPDMAHPMAAWALDAYYREGGVAERQRSLRVRGMTESSLLDLMEALVEQYPDAKLFSLPRLGAESQIEIGFRGRGDLDAPFSALRAGLDDRGVSYEPLGD
jgi:molybdopterin-biosynthesis enzyme MoeA-like protein